MHGSVLGFFAYGALQTLEVEGMDVLEVGSLDVNGSVRHLVTSRRPWSYLAVDALPGPGVDRVLDAADLVSTFGTDSFDVVLCCEMLEHAADWHVCVQEMVEVLRPGGVFVVTTRSPGFAYHHPPDHWRYTQAAFVEICRRSGLELLVLMDDPEFPGVFVKARKPMDWRAPVESLAGCPGVTPMGVPRRLLGLPYNPDGCGYYRMWQPWGELARSSGDLVVIPPPGKHLDWVPDEVEAAEFDLIARQRPSGADSVRDFRRWKDRAALVYEVDDNIFAPDRSGLPNWLDQDMRDTALACLKMADLVTVSTEPLADVMRRHNPNVTVVPNHIHADMLSMDRRRRDEVTFAWAGGITHLQDLMLVRDPLRDVLDGSGAGMHFLGWDCSSVVGVESRFTPWQVDVWDYYAAVDADVGVIPLVDTPFNACRSPIKALEYAALGIPVVASDVEAYRGFVRHGETGFLARTGQEWREYLGLLLADPDLRESMGKAARELAGEWTIQRGWTQWQAAYDTVIGAREGIRA